MNRKEQKKRSDREAFTAGYLYAVHGLRAEGGDVLSDLAAAWSAYSEEKIRV